MSDHRMSSSVPEAFTNLREIEDECDMEGER